MFVGLCCILYFGYGGQLGCGGHCRSKCKCAEYDADGVAEASHNHESVGIGRYTADSVLYIAFGAIQGDIRPYPYR